VTDDGRTARHVAWICEYEFTGVVFDCLSLLYV